jgi:hypothetical protein
LPTADTAHPSPIEKQNSQAKKSQLPVGPVVLGFFLFVVVGSGKWRCVCVRRPSRARSTPLSHTTIIPQPTNQNKPTKPTALLQIVRSATFGN